MKLRIQKDRIRISSVSILFIISFVLTIYFEVLLKINFYIVNFFYFPTILACLWWKRRGLVIPISLITFLLIVQISQGISIVSEDAINGLFINFSVIIVGIVVALLSEKLLKKELEVNANIKDLKRSNEDLQQFAYVASHDLQEPLRAITSFSQLLEEKYYEILDEAGKEYIYFITDGAKKMNNLIKDLLSYSRINTQIRPLEWKNLEPILKDALFNLQAAINESGATITNDPLPTLKVDRTQFLQLFQNFISNAIKFRRDEPPIIHIGVKKLINKWVFSIKDNGIGIDSKYFDRLYNIFYRLHTKEEYPGTGIGLPICKKIVHRYGGEIWVESELGKGSTFFFTIMIKKLKIREVMESRE
ncbi:MAG: sensor histidine kinase [Promethearchaeota archaeon]